MHGWERKRSCRRSQFGAMRTNYEKANKHTFQKLGTAIEQPRVSIDSNVDEDAITQN